LPEGEAWLHEIKLDGYRAIAGRSGSRVILLSRNDNDFSVRFPGIAKAMHILPDETLVDGEVAVLDADGRPSFKLIQNHQSLKGTLVSFVFDVLVFKGKNVMEQTLDERKAFLEKNIVPKLREPLRYMRPVEGSLDELVKSVKAHGLESLVAKRRDSKYEPGERSGAWQKMRVNQGQEFVIGGYTPIGKSFDALVFGYYEKGNLLYASRTRNGFTPSLRLELLKKDEAAENQGMPIRKPAGEERRKMGRRPDRGEDEGLPVGESAAGSANRIVEWTGDNHLRHSKFIGLRDDKEAKDVKRER
jgi:ATP-dependent DNA ligase